VRCKSRLFFNPTSNNLKELIKKINRYTNINGTYACCIVAIIACILMTPFQSSEVIAAPEEIEVYLDDFAEPGKVGLDLHLNYVTSDQPEVSPDQSTYHQFRATPELSYGINQNWEMAAYWLTSRYPDGSLLSDGVKLRMKWRPNAPSPGSIFYWAINFEAGQLSPRFYPDEVSGEIKLIGVFRINPWTLGVNVNIDRALKSNPSQGTTLEVDSKISYRIKKDLEVGIENYGYLGEIQNNTGMDEGYQATYLVSDIELDKWDLNLGIGYASGQTPDKTVLKAIVGFPF